MNFKENLNKNDESFEPVLLAGVQLDGDSDRGFQYSMDELGRLCEACFMEPVGTVTQKLKYQNSALYVGPGKLEEIKLAAEANGAVLVVFNDTLSPAQLRNLQDALGTAVMDRTSLILEIFRKRARSREARLQVELASLEYLKPRLVGMYDALTRQGGTSGSMSSRGAGETKLELDRRRMDHRLTELRRELKELTSERDVQRRQRRKSGLPVAALVGYTNAGKSTLMNAMVDRFVRDDSRKVFEADMLFATLDTTVRRVELGNNRNFLLSDTVGFINKLPTGLVEAFKSTLEEICEADLILHVVDRSDPLYREQMETTERTLAELGAGNIPEIIIYNKLDRLAETVDYPRRGERSTGVDGHLRDTVYISAVDPDSVKLLTELIIEHFSAGKKEAELLIPYEHGAAVSYLQANAEIIDIEYLESGTFMKIRCSEADLNRFDRFIIKK